MQDAVFKTQVYVMHLGKYDLILGIKWLYELGDITWNFAQLWMKFWWHGKILCFQGTKTNYKTSQSVHMADRALRRGHELNWALCNKVLELHTMIIPKPILQHEKDVIPIVVQTLLDEFVQVFEEPKGLPPHRNHDHRIILKEGTEAISLKPYREENPIESYIPYQIQGDRRIQRKDDTAFEKQSTLFALAIADIVLINMWCKDIGLEHAASRPLLKTVFQVMKRLFKPRKKTLLFVIRDHIKTPLEHLKTLSQKDIEKVCRTTDAGLAF